LIIYLVRHGEYRGENLTEHGIGRIDLLAKGLKKQNITFKHLISSPKARALQTASIIAKEFVTQVEESSLLKPNGDLEALYQFLLEKQGPILCVGHLPQLEDFVFTYTGDAVKFGNGTIAKISFTDGELGAINWIYTPEQL